MRVITDPPVSKPTSHENCLLCGNKNRVGLGLHFVPDSRGNVVAHVSGHRLLQGYEGILHGGVIAAMLDSAMANALFNNGVEAVTGDMNIKFIESVSVDSELKVVGRVVSFSSPLFKTESEIIFNRKIVATATARFVKRGFGI